VSQQLRQLKNRIRSIEGTWKVTRAMEMVSTAKYRGVEKPLDMGRKYFNKVRSLFVNLASVEDELKGPYFTSNEQDPVGLLVVTTDAGLCGGYNNHILRLADEFIGKNKSRGVKVFVYGRKGLAFFKKRGIPVEKYFPAFHGRVVGNFYEPILNSLLKVYEEGLVGEVHVAYTHFVNAMKRTPVIEKFLNIELPRAESKNFITEFGREGVLAEILPMYLSSRLRLMLLESLSSEFSARMVAMRSAKDNAKELVDDLVLLRNKVRQAMITREVIEIISSAEALKG
jgi:F-type H+-transporting ATPase subunit gamma